MARPNLRYGQDANQAVAGQVAFTTYDFAGRPLVSGQLLPSRPRRG